MGERNSRPARKETQGESNKISAGCQVGYLFILFSGVFYESSVAAYLLAENELVALVVDVVKTASFFYVDVVHGLLCGFRMLARAAPCEVVYAALSARGLSGWLWRAVGLRVFFRHFVYKILVQAVEVCLVVVFAGVMPA